MKYQSHPQPVGNAKRNSRQTNESETAYVKIKELFLRGEIEPGEVVSILYFSQLLNIGRTPVTAACQKLETEGFLRIIPKKGVLITPLSISDVRDMYEAREAIELYIGERAFANITKEDIEDLENCILRQKKCEQNEDAFGFMKEDAYFHNCIMRRYQNRTLLSLYEMMTDRIFIVGVRNSKNPARMHESIEQHIEIVDCIRKKDKENFIKVLGANILRGYVSMATIVGLPGII